MGSWEIVRKDDDEGYPTRDAAVVEAMNQLTPGDTVDVHEATCAIKWDRPCDCAPQVLVVPVPGRA